MRGLLSSSFQAPRISLPMCPRSRETAGGCSCCQHDLSEHSGSSSCSLKPLSACPPPSERTGPVRPAQSQGRVAVGYDNTSSLQTPPGSCGVFGRHQPQGSGPSACSTAKLPINDDRVPRALCQIARSYLVTTGTASCWRLSSVPNHPFRALAEFHRQNTSRRLSVSRSARPTRGDSLKTRALT